MLRMLAAVCLVVFLCVPIASAQVAAGTLVGVVQDPSQAVVPGANLVVTHVATGESRQVTTNERGEFRIPFVRIGEYTVAAEVAGFKKTTLTGILVRVDQTVNVTVTLDVGSISESVQVTSSAPLIDSSTSSLGQVIDNKKIQDLPLVGRNTFALGLLAGNTVPMTGMGTNLPFVAGGGRFQHNDVQLDGIDNNTSATGGSIGVQGVGYTPSVDAVQEFKVKTNNFSAEFGRSAGAIVAATIKSGTNQFHGSLFEFLRNEKLDANNFFSNKGRVPRQPYKQNQFGFTLGGPVRIPRVYNGTDRTWFFTDYEGTRRRTSASSTILSIPPMAFRQGDFSAYSKPIYDPGARRLGSTGQVISTPFTGNKIPQSLIDPSSTATIALLPPPNYGAANAESLNYLRVAPRPFSNNKFDVKADQRLSSSNTMFVRVSVASSSAPGVGTYDGWIGAPGTTVDNSRGAALSDTHILSPSVVNEFRFGYLRVNYSDDVPLIGQGVDFATKNNIAMFPFPIRSFPSIAFPYSGIESGSTQFNGFGGGTPTITIQNTFHWADNISVIRGNHSFKMGGEVRRYRTDRQQGGGTIYFGSIFSSSSDSAGSGAPFADYLMGFPSRADGNQTLDWTRGRDLYFGGFFQDDWKITSAFTLNAGMRYELYTQPVDARDRGGLYDIATKQMALPGKGGYTRSIVDGDHNNFAPRLGFAYRVNSKFTMRGGGGVFYARRDQNLAVAALAGNIPNVPAIPFPVISATTTVAPPRTIHTPLTATPIDPTFSSFTAANPLVFTWRTPAFHNITSPTVFQWNYSLQYELTRDIAVEAAYSGSKGNKLINRRNLNQIRWEDGMAGKTTQADRDFPNQNGSMGYDSSDGMNSYHALNLRFENRSRAGLNSLLNYTWSKELDNGNGAQAWSQNGGTTLPLDSYNLKKERSIGTLDVRHVFVASINYELPLGPGKMWLTQGPLSYVLGGWQIGQITTLRTGFASDIRSTRVASNGQLYATFNVPDRVSGVSMYLPNKGVDGYFNSAAFSEPVRVTNAKGALLTTFGNSARRVLRGPGSVNLDLSLLKTFRIHEGWNLQLRAEAFNVSNTPTFTLPAASNSTLALGNANFGRLSSSSATGRQLQLGLKLMF